MPRAEEKTFTHSSDRCSSSLGSEPGGVGLRVSTSSESTNVVAGDKDARYHTFLSWVNTTFCNRVNFVNFCICFRC